MVGDDVVQLAGDAVALVRPRHAGRSSSRSRSAVGQPLLDLLDVGPPGTGRGAGGEREGDDRGRGRTAVDRRQCRVVGRTEDEQDEDDRARRSPPAAGGLAPRTAPRRRPARALTPVLLATAARAARPQRRSTTATRTASSTDSGRSRRHQNGATQSARGEDHGPTPSGGDSASRSGRRPATMPARSTATTMPMAATIDEPPSDASTERARTRRACQKRDGPQTPASVGSWTHQT